MAIRSRLLIKSHYNLNKHLLVNRLSFLFSLLNHFLDLHQIVNSLHKELISRVSLIDWFLESQQFFLSLYDSLETNYLFLLSFRLHDLFL